MKQVKEIKEFLSRFPASIVFGVLIGLLFTLYNEKPFMSYQNLPFQALNDQGEMQLLSLVEVVAGNTVPLSVERCSTSSSKQAYVSTHELRPYPAGTPTLLPNITLEVKPGCHRGISRINMIDKNTRDGLYTVAGTAIIPGRFKTHYVDWYSEPFRVIHKE